MRWSDLDLFCRYIMTMPDANITMDALRKYFKPKDVMEYVKISAFSSKCKYSEIVTKDNTYRLGAPEFIFNKDELTAQSIMLNVHKKGKAVVGKYPYDIAATKVNKALSRAKNDGFPFRMSIEEA